MPRVHSMVTFDKETGRLQSCTINASPIGSTLRFEHEHTESLRVTLVQSQGYWSKEWKPGEVVLDGVESIRALRDACNKFLDRFHDEVES